MGVKISELTSAGTLAGTEKIPCVDSGTQYTTPADIKTYILPARAEWRADTYAGYGGTDTKIPYFTNVRVNVDTASALTVVNNSTNGCKITINTAGIYAISFSLGSPTSGYSINGITLNSAELTTDVTSVDVSTVLNYARAAADTGDINAAAVSWVGYLAATSIVRPHTIGGVPANTRDANFSICRLA